VVTPPDGWVVDQKAAKTNNVQMLVPKGKTGFLRFAFDNPKPQQTYEVGSFRVDSDRDRRTNSSSPW
jgi:hypothetical protein